MFDFYDREGYELDRDGLDIRKASSDDPCTIEFNDLDDIPFGEMIAPDDSHRYHYPTSGSKINGLVIPFKGVGTMTVNLQYRNEIYGVLREDQPIRYDVSRNLWHRCPPDYFLCYTPTHLRLAMITNPAMMKKSYRGYDQMGRMSPTGEQVISILANPDVRADNAVKAFKALGLQIEGKLVRVYDSGWTLDDETLNLNQLLVSNRLIQ